MTILSNLKYFHECYSSIMRKLLKYNVMHFVNIFLKRKLNDNTYNIHKEPRLETLKKVQWLKAPTQELPSSNTY